MELLESEKQKVIKELDAIKQRRTDNSKVKPVFPVAEVSTEKMDLYRIALQIREANKISQYLKKNMVWPSLFEADSSMLFTIEIQVYHTLSLGS